MRSQHVVLWLLRHRVSLFGAQVLVVPGRVTGRARSVPVNLLIDRAGDFLVAPRGETDWVKNLRAAKSGQLVLGTRARQFAAREITSDERKVRVLRQYLSKWGWQVGAFFPGLSQASADAEFLAVAARYPVFEID